MKFCDFQIQNASGVLMVLNKIKDEYPVKKKDIQKGLSSFRLKGRFQMILGEIPKILDVAHNRESIKALVENLKIDSYIDENFLKLYNNLLGQIINDLCHIKEMYYHLCFP